MTFKIGDKLRFTGASDAQVNFGGGDDPRKFIENDSVHEVESVEVRSWHTKIRLRGIRGEFNSVCFAPE